MKMNVVICFWKVRLFWFFSLIVFTHSFSWLQRLKKRALRVRSSPVTVHQLLNKKGVFIRRWLPRRDRTYFCSIFFSSTTTPEERKLYTPESSWKPSSPSSGCQKFFGSENHVFHFVQVFLISCNRVRLATSSFCASFALSKTWMARPEEACHAIWQWKAQAPGLSALNAMAIKPLAGNKTTSRRGGLSNLGWKFVTLYSRWDCWRRAKSWPWRCI